MTAAIFVARQAGMTVAMAVAAAIMYHRVQGWRLPAAGMGRQVRVACRPVGRFDDLAVHDDRSQ